MVTRAIKPKREESILADWQAMPEKAPSVVLEATPTLARVFFLVGLLFTAIGGLSLLLPAMRFRYMVSPGWGMFFLSVGVFLILLHALLEREQQFRRAYAFFAMVLMFVSTALGVLPIGGTVGAYFPSIGIPGLAMSLLIIGATLRFEGDIFWRNFMVLILLVFSVGIIFAGIMLTNNWPIQNNLGTGILLLILGLFYAAIMISYQPEERASFCSVALGFIGLFCIILGVLRSRYAEGEYLVPSGLGLICMGALYILVCVGARFDWPLVVLTRRELASIFYSPVAYPVLIGLLVISFFNFGEFVGSTLEGQAMGQDMTEPIVAIYIANLVPVVAQMFLVPILTMRIMSEEKRTGTLEVLLTAPVNETTVVLSKFFAVLIFFMTTWVPWGVFLVALRVVGGEEFDYRPALSFALALLSTGAGFMAMGLFCSTITRNQMVAAVLSFVFMMAYLVLLFAKRRNHEYNDLLTYVSYLDLWFASLQGQVIPRYLLFHVSAAVFFLYLAVKVLEFRKWR